MNTHLLFSPAPEDFLRRLRLPAWSELYGRGPKARNLLNALSTPSLLPDEVSLTFSLWLRGIGFTSLDVVFRRMVKL
jgi:hypothetical protein